LPDRTPFEILGISPDAEPEVIAAAYRALAKKYHPDGNGNAPADANARMVELNWARDELNRDLAGWRARVAATKSAEPATSTSSRRPRSAQPETAPPRSTSTRRKRHETAPGVTAQPTFVFLKGRRGESALIKTYADDIERGAIKARFKAGIIDVKRVENTTAGSTFRIAVVKDVPADATVVERVTFRAPSNTDVVVRVSLSPPPWD
jgi:hypothetical protein